MGENGTELVKAESGLIAASPEQIVPKAAQIAKQLAKVIQETKSSVSISGRSHVKVEGWTTLLALLHVQPEIEWSRKVDAAAMTWEARVVLVHWPTGRRVGAAEAMASDDEPNASKSWGRSEFSVRSMAQTRAVGKAARLSFSWVMVLAGFDATPAEEMPRDAERSRPERISGKRKLTDLEVARLDCLAIVQRLVANGLMEPNVIGRDPENIIAREIMRHDLMGTPPAEFDEQSPKCWRDFKAALQEYETRNTPPEPAGAA